MGTISLLWFISGQSDTCMQRPSASDLSSVERLVTGVVVVEEEHVDKGDEETGSILGYACIVCEPLIKDQND